MTMRRIGLTLIALACAAPGVRAEGEDRWIESYEEAIRQAQVDNKPIFLDFWRPG